MLSWRRFVLAAVGSFGAIIAGLVIFIVLMNPYGNLPKLLFSEHAITDINQRFQYPSLIRSGRLRFDRGRRVGCAAAPA